MKVGILGGSFNPIHRGHIELAEYVYHHLSLDYIFVMPNYKPAYKTTKKDLLIKERGDMVKLAIKGQSYLRFNDMELNRGGFTYTIDTLKELHATMPEDEFYFIMGADSLITFTEWKCYKDLFQYATMVCVNRGGYPNEELLKVKYDLQQETPQAKIILLDLEPVAISSSQIRKLIANHEDVSAYLTDEVAKYIEKNHLYQEINP